ncbi:multiheme c-type cytochrome [Nitratidesulfovibrio vulgaris]|uniref:Cytochrome c family protein n=2 Tax=Nitratidesulfovibrio vulgaris TaxID=881 RepID=Q726K0_NITV2|nr:c-type cytochrome [Nitratidesulfovibrio vulgaris]AAS97578.1 cytochrome c family protein [Nitratidesulfovibrio vulgaris str. Hildenborough]ADP88013.1 cytochrome c class I [Nitratidesulfovibrio vulgaris RCH1]
MLFARPATRRHDRDTISPLRRATRPAALLTALVSLVLLMFMTTEAPTAAPHAPRKVPDKGMLTKGATLFRQHCGGCHTAGTTGNDIMPLTRHLTVMGLEAYIDGQGIIFEHMPRFDGTPEDRDAIAAWVMVTLHGKPYADPPSAKLPQLPFAIPAFDMQKDEYVLLTWNTLGMKCITDCDAAYSYLPPGNALGAVLIKRGEKPEMVTEGVRLTYEAPEGFRFPSRHTEYWKYSASISGRQLPADTSTTGRGMDGTLDFNPKSATFEAAGIPVVPYSDDGTINPYPLFSVKAVDRVTGKQLARTEVVVPVGTEMSCWRCHGGGWARPEGTGVSLTTARSILTVHDKRSGTDLVARADAGKPVLCQSCHPDPLLNAKGDPARLNLPTALHGFHVNYLKGRGAEVCANCHPDSNAGFTRCLRGSHGKAGQTCVSCHGYLEDHALSLLKKEAELGKTRTALFMRDVKPRLVDSVDAINARTPWAQQPDCLTCHKEAYERPAKTASAFNVWTKDGSGLYRARKEMTGKVPCIACHNSPHATHPSDNPFGRDRDAVQVLQYQKLNAAIGAKGNCKVCHGPATKLTPDMSPHHPMR